MNTFRKVLIGLVAALAVTIPAAAAITASHVTPNAVVRIAAEPTPTPSHTNSGGCHSTGC